MIVCNCVEELNVGQYYVVFPSSEEDYIIGTNKGNVFILNEGKHDTHRINGRTLENMNTDGEHYVKNRGCYVVGRTYRIMTLAEVEWFKDNITKHDNLISDPPNIESENSLASIIAQMRKEINL